MIVASRLAMCHNIVTKQGMPTMTHHMTVTLHRETDDGDIAIKVECEYGVYAAERDVGIMSPGVDWVAFNRDDLTASEKEWLEEQVQERHFG